MPLGGQERCCIRIDVQLDIREHKENTDLLVQCMVGVCHPNPLDETVKTNRDIHWYYST